MINSFYTKKAFAGLVLTLLVWANCQAVSGLGDDLFKKPEPYVSLDANYSRLFNRQVQFSGYGVGFDFDSRISLGLTLYRLTTKVFTPRFSQGADWRLRMGYLSFLTSYTLLEKSKWKVVGELGNGFGNINFLEGLVDRGRYGLYVFEPNLYARYNILSWLGLAAQAGYRITFTGGPPSVGDLSSAKFDIGFTVMAIPLYRAIKNKDFS